MAENLRALVVIITLTTIVFVLARKYIYATTTHLQDFDRRRNLWIAITCLAFLAHNFWLFVLVTGMLLHLTRIRETNVLALYFFLLFAFPPVGDKIGGLGVINHLFVLNGPRLLAIVLLLPATIKIMQSTDSLKFGKAVPDKFLIGYIALNILLHPDLENVTGTARNLFYAFLDIFLPYFVASRALNNLQKFREAIMAFVLASMLLSILAIFESVWHWLLYSSVPQALGTSSGIGGYLERNDHLRAQVTAGQPIPLGYVIAVALGMYGFLKNAIPNRTIWLLGFALLLGGLIAPLSKGPWVGYLAIVIVMIATGLHPFRGFVRLGFSLLIGVIVLLQFPIGERLIDYLPFVGAVDEGSIGYRQLLFDISIAVILDNPFFGSYSFSLYLEELRQGQGIIDIVNSYLGIALPTGLVGLTLFAGFFISAAIGLLSAMRKSVDKEQEPYMLGQALLATLVGILVTIYTVSSISFIPLVYWSITGLIVGWTNLMLRMQTTYTRSGNCSLEQVISKRRRYVGRHSAAMGSLQNNS